MGLSQQFKKAMEVAFRIHREQTRKGTEIPYMSHVMAVSSLAMENGATETEAIAALLHDVIEDSDGKYTPKDLEYDFGPEICKIVLELSDTTEHPKPPWKERKLKYISHMQKDASKSAILISACDKFHNLTCIYNDFQKENLKLWERFNAEASDILWYYYELYKVFKENKVPKRILYDYAEMVDVLIGDNKELGIKFNFSTEWDEERVGFNDLDEGRTEGNPFDVALDLFHSGDMEGLTKHCERVLQNPEHQDNIEIWKLFGIGLVETQRFDAAITAFETARKFDYEDFAVTCNLITANFQKGDKKRALELLSHSLKIFQSDSANQLLATVWTALDTGTIQEEELDSEVKNAVEKAEGRYFRELRELCDEFKLMCKISPYRDDMFYKGINTDDGSYSIHMRNNQISGYQKTFDPEGRDAIHLFMKDGRHVILCLDDIAFSVLPQTGMEVLEGMPDVVSIKEILSGFDNLTRMAKEENNLDVLYAHAYAIRHFIQSANDIGVNAEPLDIRLNEVMKNLNLM